MNERKKFTTVAVLVGIIYFGFMHQIASDLSELKGVLTAMNSFPTASSAGTESTIDYFEVENAFDVSIIITSSLIPSHPSLTIIKEAISSLKKLDGLPTYTPIYITVDGQSASSTSNRTSDLRRRAEYIRRLKRTNFSPFTNVVILPMHKHLHIAGSVNQALLHILESVALTTNSTKEKLQQIHQSSENHFVYLLQHDFFFRYRIPHLQLVQAMREYPEDLKNIRFRYNNNYEDENNTLKNDFRRFPPCVGIENGTTFIRNGLPFFATARWSDNNQLSTLEYYRHMIHTIRKNRNGRLNMPMEFVMMRKAEENCTAWGQAVLGDRAQQLSYLGHLDGRNFRTSENFR